MWPHAAVLVVSPNEWQFREQASQVPIGFQLSLGQRPLEGEIRQKPRLRRRGLPVLGSYRALRGTHCGTAEMRADSRHECREH